MNGSIFIHPQPLVWVSFYSSTTSGIDLFLFIQNLWYGLFSFIHNLWYKFLIIHPQPQVWVSFRDPYQRLWMKKETYTRGCG
jgi:uncharacterized membrane protein